MNDARERSRAGGILVAGLALAALGLGAESQVSTDQSSRSIPVVPGYGTADSNGTMIAVTGIDVTGGSILYLVDTQARQLAVYSATGGTSSTMGVKFIGARKIDLDLRVDGYNDKSDYTYKELAEQFSRAGAGGGAADGQ
ncbi:MAG: hypothetical protein AB1726_06720 [Planctomycetota bacterium]